MMWRVKILLGTVLFCALCLSQSNKPANDRLMYLRVLDVPHPFCDEPIVLDVAKDYFVEIGNDLAGVNEYNEMIRLYRAKAWDGFDGQWKEFQEAFAKSPLMEPATFLVAQTQFDRLKSAEQAEVAGAEKIWREVTLAYPGSELGPVITATAANFFNQHGLLHRALATYQVALKKYPDSDLKCVFEMGIAESAYQLRDWQISSEHLSYVEKNCKNNRLLAGAALRRADSEWINDKPTVEKRYGYLLDKYTPQVNRFFQSALYNMGERMYTTHRFKESSFYFEQFLKHEKEGSCIAHAQKRKADLALQEGQNWQKVAGLYFAVYDLAPKSDLGQFSYIHGLLMGAWTISHAEFDRRLRIIDGMIDSIKDERLRSAAYLEKGLALLDAGDLSAIDYLARYEEKTPFSDKHPELVAFVREKTMSIFNDIAEGKAQKNEADALKMMESAFAEWLKNGSQKVEAAEVYAKFNLKIFDRRMESGDYSAAVTVLNHWASTDFWGIKPLSWAQRREVSEQILSVYFDLVPSQRGSMVSFYKDNSKILDTFFGSEYAPFWLTLALGTASEDPTAYQEVQKKMNASRDIAQISEKISPYLSNEFWFAYGEAYAREKSVAKAEAAYAKIKDPDFEEEIHRSLFALYQSTHAYSKAFQQGWEMMDHIDDPEKKTQLPVLLQLANVGKLFEKAPDLLDDATENGFQGKDIAPFRYFAGRFYYQKSQWKKGIKQLEIALKDDPNSTESARAEYFLAKCYSKTSKRSQAKKVLMDLAKKKDPFWSPLASNDLKALK